MKQEDDLSYLNSQSMQTVYEVKITYSVMNLTLGKSDMTFYIAIFFSRYTCQYDLNMIHVTFDKHWCTRWNAAGLVKSYTPVTVITI